MKLFVTAIGTDSGKTLVSAILCRALEADYWKPIQSGTVSRDSNSVTQLAPATKVHPEAYLFKAPTSPHKAAQLEERTIDLSKFKLPKTSSNLIIEGAGGIMVPINDKQFVLDLIIQLNVEVVLVVNLYLGAINHAILTIDKLKDSGVTIRGLVFNGNGYEEGKEYVEQYSGLPIILELNQLEKVTSDEVARLAQKVTI